MRISEINDEEIRFDNGEYISYFHYQDCCECNYADFSQLDDIARNAEFSAPLDFEFLEEQGFRFGNLPNQMFFVPCYSVQNGYYSSDIQIEYNGEPVLSGNCEERYY